MMVLCTLTSLLPAVRSVLLLRFGICFFGLYAFAFDIGFDAIVFAFELNLNLDIDIKFIFDSEIESRERGNENSQGHFLKLGLQHTTRTELELCLSFLAYLLSYCAVLFTLLACLCLTCFIIRRRDGIIIGYVQGFSFRLFCFCYIVTSTYYI